MKFFLITLLTFMSLNVLSQTKKVRNNVPFIKNVRVEYEVLASDKNTKHGFYKRFAKGKLSTVGEYQNNKRTGVWRTYNFDGSVETEVDFTNKTLKYYEYDDDAMKVGDVESFIAPDRDHPAIALIGSQELAYSYTSLIRYPAEARIKEIVGRVIVSVDVDETGKVVGYKIHKSVHQSLDDEALRVIKLINFEFFPAYSDGKYVESQYLFPIFFKLGF